jgi:molecular chaperone Hsp33
MYECICSLSDLGEVAVLVVDGTQLVAEVSACRAMCRDCVFTTSSQAIALTIVHNHPQAATRHKTAPTATAALGRALLGTLLMSSFRKEDEVLQVGV